MSMSYSDENPTPFLELPYLVREKVWKSLEYSEQLSIRKVCKTFKTDIDNNIGLTWTITNELHGLWWFKNIKVTKCVIKQMDRLKTAFQNELEDFFKDPTTIESLHFRPISSILETDVLTITQLCRNLVEINIQTLNLSLIHFTDQILLEELLEMTQSMRSLRKLTVIMYPIPRTSVRDFRKFYTLDDFDHTVNYIDPAAPYCNCDLTDIILEVPKINVAIISEWKTFLQRQRKLKTFVCNFGLIFWGFFSRIIEYNAATLEKVVLRRITGILEAIPEETRRNAIEIPFDWFMFSECRKLRYVKIFHDDISVQIPYPRLLPNQIRDFAFPIAQVSYLKSVNFDSFPCDTIQQLHLRNMRVDVDHLEDFRFKSLENLVRFRGRSNAYIDDGEEGYLEVANQNTIWSDIPVQRQIHLDRGQMDLQRLFNDIIDNDEEQRENTTDIPLLLEILYFFISWFLLIFGCLSGPFIIICMLVVSFIIP